MFVNAYPRPSRCQSTRRPEVCIRARHLSLQPNANFSHCSDSHLISQLRHTWLRTHAPLLSRSLEPPSHHGERSQGHGKLFTFNPDDSDRTSEILCMVNPAYRFILPRAQLRLPCSSLSRVSRLIVRVCSVRPPEELALASQWLAKYLCGSRLFTTRHRWLSLLVLQDWIGKSAR